MEKLFLIHLIKKKKNAKKEKMLIEEIETLKNSEHLDFDTINSKRKELESLRQKGMEGAYIKIKS